MLRMLLIFASVSLVMLPANSPSITSGWRAIEREFQSAVQVWTIEENMPKYLCSGVAIAPDVIVTASSCVASETTIFVSTHLELDFNLPLTQALQSVSAIARKGIKHHEADFMLIFLSQALKLEPAMLLSINESFQIRLLDQVIIAGFGFDNPPKELSRFERITEKFFGSEQHREHGKKIIAKSNIFSVSAKEISLGRSPEDGAACSGDEGAPVFAHIDTPSANSQRVIGIIAASPLLDNCAQPSRSKT